MHDPVLGQDVLLLMRPANEHDLCVPNLDDLLKLAGVAVALVGVEPPEHGNGFTTCEEILEPPSRPPRRLGQPHAREADLVELVQVEHLLQIRPRSIQNAENQSDSVVAAVALLREFNDRVVQAAGGDIERCVHRFAQGELQCRHEPDQLGLAIP
jgi:hypothetical protein